MDKVPDYEPVRRDRMARNKQEMKERNFPGLPYIEKLAPSLYHNNPQEQNKDKHHDDSGSNSDFDPNAQDETVHAEDEPSGAKCKAKVLHNHITKTEKL